VRIRVVTPAPRGSRRGNRMTAERWARLLRGLGHRVTVEESWRGGACGLLVALHARKSAASIARSRRDAPERPIVLALTGTDVYGDLDRSAAARRSLELADCIVVLQPLAARRVPRRLRGRVRTVVQSHAALGRRRRRSRARHGVRVCVLGHLRPVKDPFRAALAVRRLHGASRVSVAHAGAALTPAMARRARAEERRNPRYRWLGELTRAEAMRVLASSDVLVLSSRSEGGANAIGEAIVRGVPVIASRVPGNVGLLGADYPGYFPVGDTARLARLLDRAERDPAFVASLERACARRRPLFHPARERAAWRRVLRETRVRGARRRATVT
jgi:putative glycosyltransferase (TIGR04348 family)